MQNLEEARKAQQRIQSFRQFPSKQPEYEPLKKEAIEKLQVIFSATMIQQKFLLEIIKTYPQQGH